MSPKDDVNRLKTLAIGPCLAQQNLHIDMSFWKIESRILDFPFYDSALARTRAAYTLGTKKGGPNGPPSNVFPQGLRQAIALTRADSRDILRLAVFLWNTPLVTPRISSG